MTSPKTYAEKLRTEIEAQLEQRASDRRRLDGTSLAIVWGGSALVVWWGIDIAQQVTAAL